MSKEEYQHYLKSEWWLKRRVEIKKLRGWACEECQEKSDLQVHHLSYKNLGCEPDEDLQVLCGFCHHARHRIERTATQMAIKPTPKNGLLKVLAYLERLTDEERDLIAVKTAIPVGSLLSMREALVLVPQSSLLALHILSLGRIALFYAAFQKIASISFSAASQ